MEQRGLNNSSDNEISFEELVQLSRRFVRKSLKLWWMFMLLFVLLAGILVGDALLTPPEYKATFTFMRNEDEGNGLSGVGSILGQFGIRGGRNRFNLDGVLELAKSRRIVQETIFEEVQVDSLTDYLGNFVIDIYELDKDWVLDEQSLEGYRFTADSLGEYSPTDLYALKRVYMFIIGSENREGLVSASYSEESNILSFSATTRNEDLSLRLIEELYENLADYYITHSVAKQRATYDIVKSKADSIGGVLRAAEMEYARFRDANQNLFTFTDRLRQEQLSRDIQKLNIIHAEALKNVEIADFSLKNATPVIVELDEPVKPLETIRKSLIRAIAISMILTIVLGTGIILLLYLYKRARTFPD